MIFQEDEKKHLARELHDGINQLLVSSRCHLELLGNKLQSEDLKVHLNKSKHSQATKVTVIAQQIGNVLQLLIQDYGVFFNTYKAMEKRGIGLRNIRERLEFIGGDFELMSEIGLGTEITVLLTLEGLMNE